MLAGGKYKRRDGKILKNTFLILKVWYDDSNTI